MLFQGTKAWEDYWGKRKHIDDKGIGWSSIEHPHRKMLIDTISKFSPESILEIGCGSGVNLYLLAKKFPNALIWGIDINKKSIEYGKAKFKELGIDKVKLLNQSADDLVYEGFKYDVVFTDAMLIYIGTDKIRQLMSHIIRLAKKGIVLCEWHNERLCSLGQYKDGVWQRNYRNLLQGYSTDSNIKITRIPKSVWSEWNERGAIIEVKL